MSQIRSLLGCMSLAASFSVFAVETLPTVQVVADSERQPIDVDQVDPETFSGFARQVGREDFSQRVATVSDVLNQTNGVQIRQIGGYGGFSSINLRGSGAKQVNLYLDGMLVNSAQTGGADLNLIPSAILQRIELYPDFTPIQLGSANIGGAINLVTLDAFTPLRELGVARGSFGLERYSFVASDILGGWNFLMGVDSESADNDYEVFNDNNTEFNTSDDRWEKMNNSQYKQTSALLKAGKSWNSDQKLEMLLNWNETEKGIPSIDNNMENEALLNGQQLRGHIKYNIAFGNVVTSQRLFASHEKQRYDDRGGGTGISNEYLRTQADQWGLASVSSFDWLNSTTYLNVEYREETFAETNLYNRRKALDNQRSQLLTGLQNDSYWLAETLMVSVSTRHQRVDDEVLLEPNSAQTFFGTDFSNVSGSEHTESLGLTYQPWPALRLKANIARQIRIPTLQERFGTQGQFIGNPQLKTERSKNWDAGWLFEYRSVQFQYSYFEKALEDGIVLEFDSQGYAKARNVDSADISGSELDLSWQTLGWLRLQAGATFTDSVNNTDILAIQGKQLSGIYHKTFNVAAIASWHPWLLRLQYQVDDELFYDAANTVWPGQKETMDVELRWELPHWSVQMNLHNVLDEQFQDFNRFWGPGRSLNLNLTMYW